MIRFWKIRPYERGLLFRDGAFVAVLEPGWRVVLGWKQRLEISSVRDPWIRSKDLELIVRSGELDGVARVLDLRDEERALVWVDGRFEAIVGPGLAALWTVFRKVRVEVVDARTFRLESPELDRILAAPAAASMIEVV